MAALDDYTSDSDTMILEDETGRVTVGGSNLPVGQLPTGGLGV